ncbi:hypothetical protein V8F06_000761 [Rhypophila decipiens]
MVGSQLKQRGQALPGVVSTNPSAAPSGWETHESVKDQQTIARKDLPTCQPTWHPQLKYPPKFNLVASSPRSILPERLFSSPPFPSLSSSLDWKQQPHQQRVARERTGRKRRRHPPTLFEVDRRGVGTCFGYVSQGHKSESACANLQEDPVSSRSCSLIAPELFPKVSSVFPQPRFSHGSMFWPAPTVCVALLPARIVVSISVVSRDFLLQWCQVGICPTVRVPNESLGELGELARRAAHSSPPLPTVPVTCYRQKWAVLASHARLHTTVQVCLPARDPVAHSSSAPRLRLRLTVPCSAHRPIAGLAGLELGNTALFYRAPQKTRAFQLAGQVLEKSQLLQSFPIPVPVPFCANGGRLHGLETDEQP